MGVSNARYTRVAIALHWAIALLILVQLGTGLWMVDAIQVQATQALAFETYQLHKSVGLTILVLTALRIVWRLTHRPPPLPDGMGQAARLAASSAHVGFYVLLVGLPLTGWAMVSASPWNLPTIYFGLFTWPHLPGLDTLPAADKPAVEGAFKSAHEIAGWVMVGLLALHVGAALKHHFVDRDGVLGRMIPGLRT